MEDAFVKADGKLDIAKISEALAEARKIVEEHLEKGELAKAVFKLLSAALVFSSHFAQDEMYNYVTDTFNPDNTFTELFNVIIEQFGKKKKVVPR